ncbi:MAG: GxxExxY protein [Verrucomicrobiota bacterium]
MENSLLVELKAVETLTKAHEVQLVNYLTATGIDYGLLLNFGSQSLQFKKKLRTYRSSSPPPLHSIPQDNES